MPSQKPPAPYAPPAVVLLHWHSPMSCFCVKALLIASLCLNTQKSATLFCGLHGRPSPFRYATLLSRGGHSRPHPASQGRSGGRRSAVTAGSEQLIFINNKRQKYIRKILNQIDRLIRNHPKEQSIKKGRKNTNAAHRTALPKKTKRQPP